MSSMTDIMDCNGGRVITLPSYSEITTVDENLPLCKNEQCVWNIIDWEICKKLNRIVLLY